MDTASGDPIALGRVTLVDSAGRPTVFSITDPEGFFHLTAGEPGDYLVNAVSLFYLSYSDGPIHLGRADTVAVEFSLTPNPAALDPIVVEVRTRRRSLLEGGYYDREKTGLGYHLDRERIEAHAFQQITDILYTVPGVKMVPTTFGGREPYFGRGNLWRRLLTAGQSPGCSPRVYVDGMVWSWGGDVPTEIDQLLHPEELEAMEVYTSHMEVPGEFGGLGASCGLILLWTR